MRFWKNTCIIGKKDNVLLVDFTPKSEPPAPRFPGANALRQNTAEEVQLWVASLGR